MNLAIRRYIEKIRGNLKLNMVYYLIVFFIFVVGIMAGGYSGAALPSGARRALSAYIGGVFDASTGSFAISSVFFQSLFAHVLLLLLISLCGLSIVLIPVSLFALLFRGFLVGFAAAALMNHAGAAGPFALLLCVVLPGLLLAPCYLYIAAGGMRSGVESIKLRGAAQNRARVREYYSKAASAFLFSLIGIALETMVVPLWLRLIAGAA